MSLDPIPSRPIITEQGAVLDRVYQSWFASIQRWLGPVGQSGFTAARPSNGLYVGLAYFDSTLGKPVFVKSLNPAVWVDATGTVV